MTYRKAKAIVEGLGLSVSRDGLGFTVCGNRLVDGSNCPPWLSRLNGCTVFEIAEEAVTHTATK